MKNSQDTFQSTLDVAIVKRDKSEILYEKALKSNSLKEFDEALILIDEALKMDDGFSEFWNLKALILDKLKRYDESIECFDRALELNDSKSTKTDKARMLYDYARVLHFPQMENEKALQAITEAIEILDENEDHSEYWFLKGEILEGLGQLIEARKAFYIAEGNYDKFDDLNNQIFQMEKYSEDVLINVTGTGFYHGIEPFKEGVILDLIREPDNEHDSDAIAVLIDGEKVGYVANSDYTVIDEVKSAREIKNMFTDSAKAEFLFVYLNELIIARLIKK